MPTIIDGTLGLTTPTYGGADTSEYLVPVTQFKNRIINGDMRIDQRNAGASVTNSTGNIYTLDRWYSTTTGSICTVQQVTGSTGNNRAIRVTGASGNGTTQLSQRIEATNIYDCVSQTVTVSFTLYGSGSGSVSVRFLYPTATDNFSSITEPVAGTTVNFTTTATRYSVTRTLDSNANKGLWIVFDRGPTGAGVTWTLEEVQLEVGSTATSFDYRPYGTELALCQRYFETTRFPSATFNQSTTRTSVISSANNNVGGNTSNFVVSKRAAPTVTLFSRNNTSGQVSLVSNGLDFAGSATANQINPMGFSNILLANNATSGALIEFGYLADAEL